MARNGGGEAFRELEAPSFAPLPVLAKAQLFAGGAGRALSS
jgi:hypothetical protein